MLASKIKPSGLTLPVLWAKVWQEYRAGRAEKGGTKGKGKTGKSKDKGKGKGNGKDQKGEATANATIGSSDRGKGSFPKGAVGLDSWANVWLRHVSSSDEVEQWDDPLRLADGSVIKCATQIGPKGIPQALVEKQQGRENIDLVPMFWLI